MMTTGKLTVLALMLSIMAVAASGNLTLPHYGTVSEDGYAFKISNTYAGAGSSYGGFFYAKGIDGRGVFGQSAGSSGMGVKGWASNDGNVENFGGHFCATGQRGIGVYGWAENTGNVENYGGFFRADGYAGMGVYGIATYSGRHDADIKAVNYGGYFEAAAPGGRGVYGKSDGSFGVGVYGEAHGLGPLSAGVAGIADGPLAAAVKGVALANGFTITYGGEFVSNSPSGTGVRAIGNGSNGIGLYATSPTHLAAYFDGKVKMGGMPKITLSNAKRGVLIRKTDDTLGYFDIDLGLLGDVVGVYYNPIKWVAENLDELKAAVDWIPGISSLRFKEDVKPLEDDFERILEIEPKSFAWKKDGRQDIGVIAEEIEALGLTNLVYYKDGEPYGVKYTHISLYLLQVLKEQVRQTRELRAENQELETRIDTLTERIAVLEHHFKSRTQWAP